MYSVNVDKLVKTSETQAAAAAMNGASSTVADAEQIQVLLLSVRNRATIRLRLQEPAEISL